MFEGVYVGRRLLRGTDTTLYGKMLNTRPPIGSGQNTLL